MSQGNTIEAEKFFRLAIAEAENLPASDPKLSLTLNNLANCLRQQGRYADAEPLYKRAITAKEKQVGMKHMDLAILLENYAKLLRLAGRPEEAAKIDSRVRAIYVKN